MSVKDMNKNPYAGQDRTSTQAKQDDVYGEANCYISMMTF